MCGMLLLKLILCVEYVVAWLFSSLSTPSQLFYENSSPGNLEYTQNGLQLVINNKGDNPTLTSNFQIQYGKVSADIAGSSGRGIISSFYLQADDLDEIDIVELFGTKSGEFQSNFFVKGNISTYTRGAMHEVINSTLSEFHKYGIEWTPQRILWLLDGTIVREVSSMNDEGYPTSPMKLYISLWAGGDSENEFGTIEWAGGQTIYQSGPFKMIIKNIQVEGLEEQSDSPSISHVEEPVHSMLNPPLVEFFTSLSNNAVISIKNESFEEKFCLPKIVSVKNEAIKCYTKSIKVLLPLTLWILYI